jgi:ABC-type transport system substrate-binding protein
MGIEIESVTATDQWTVEIKLTKPHLDVLGKFLNGYFFAHAPEQIEEYGDAKDWRNLVGTGPFRLTDFVEGSSATWEKSPDYWGYDEKFPENRLPYIDQLRALVMPEPATRLAALRSGRIDYVGFIGTTMIQSLEQVDSLLKTNPELGIWPAAAASNNSMGMNIQLPPFDDIRVRQAAQMAMDRHAWNQAMSGGEGFPYRGSLVPPGHAASFQVPEDEYPYPYNPEMAKALLEEYAAEKGISLPISMMGAFMCTEEQKEDGCHDLPEQPITITTSSSANNIRRAEISKAYYEAVGFKVEMDIGGGDEAKRTFVTKEASFSLRGFGLRPHPSGTFNSYLGYGGYWNNGGYGTSEAQLEIDRLVMKAAQTFDPADQNYLYQQAQRLYMENALGGVRTAANPSYHFMQSSVMWAEFPDSKWVKYPSDASVKIHDVWLEQ